jgi:hypothetical protein
MISESIAKETKATYEAFKVFLTSLSWQVTGVLVKNTPHMTVLH